MRTGFDTFRDQIDQSSFSLFGGSPPTSPISAPGIGPGRPVGTPSGNTETTIFGSGNDTMPFLDQGHTNGCGTTSLAMISSYLLGRPISQADVDHEVRRWDIFSPPGELVEFAREQGLEAELYNHGTWDELKGFLDRGIPAQAIISNDNTGDLSTLHYVAVVGYGKDAGGNEYVVLHDPNYGDDPSTAALEGELKRMPLSEFLQKWEKPPAGFDNTFIAYAPGGTDLPPGRDDGIEGTLTTAEGVGNIVNGLDRIGHFWESPLTFYRGALELEAGVVQTVGGAVFGGIELGGDWLHDKVDDVPVLSNIAAPVADLISGVGAVGADVVHAAGQFTEDLGEGLEKLGKGDIVGFGEELVEAGGDIVEGVVDVVSDTASTIGSAVKDFFSGW